GSPPSWCGRRCSISPSARRATSAPPPPRRWWRRPSIPRWRRSASSWGRWAMPPAPSWPTGWASCCARWRASRPAVSTAAEPAAPAVARFLALAEEGGVVHRLAVRVLLEHVPDVVVVVGDPAAQARGLHHPPPDPAVGGVVVERDQRAGHQSQACCCPGSSSTRGVSRSVRAGLARGLRIAPTVYTSTYSTTSMKSEVRPDSK